MKLRALALLLWRLAWAPGPRLHAMRLGVRLWWRGVRR